MDACVCLVESFCCSLDTIITLLIGYTPIQNKKLNEIMHVCVYVCVSL